MYEDVCDSNKDIQLCGLEYSQYSTCLACGWPEFDGAKTNTKNVEFLPQFWSFAHTLLTPRDSQGGPAIPQVIEGRSRLGHMNQLPSIVSSAKVRF